MNMGERKTITINGKDDFGPFGIDKKSQRRIYVPGGEKEKTYEVELDFISSNYVQGIIKKK